MLQNVLNILLSKKAEHKIIYSIFLILLKIFGCLYKEKTKGTYYSVDVNSE
jgi:hypothetical protein